MTGTIDKNNRGGEQNEQVLDKLNVEKERGITVKAQTVSMFWTPRTGATAPAPAPARGADNESTVVGADAEKPTPTPTPSAPVAPHPSVPHLINLIDTPGHVDFSYEVSRSLSACDGVLLLVDASQGIQAQTLSVFYSALAQDLPMIAVLNKVDLPHADVDKVSKQIEEELGLPMKDHLKISAKSGMGVESVLEAIVERLPAPVDWRDRASRLAGTSTAERSEASASTGTTIESDGEAITATTKAAHDTPSHMAADSDNILRALIFDTYYDRFRGVVCYVRIFSGSLKKGDKIFTLSSGRKYEVQSVGIFYPEETPVDILGQGSVGYIVCNMKNPSDIDVGDTISDNPDTTPLPGFKTLQSNIYAGVFPLEATELPMLEESITRLTMNDRSVAVQKESSTALGQGFRLGFLGTLHMDVWRQRLSDEYRADVVITAPSVRYLGECDRAKRVSEGFLWTSSSFGANDAKAE